MDFMQFRQNMDFPIFECSPISVKKNQSTVRLINVPDYSKIIKAKYTFWHILGKLGVVGYITEVIHFFWHPFHLTCLSYDIYMAFMPYDMDLTWADKGV